MSSIFWLAGVHNVYASHLGFGAPSNIQQRREQTVLSLRCWYFLAFHDFSCYFHTWHKPTPTLQYSFPPASAAVNNQIQRSGSVHPQVYRRIVRFTEESLEKSKDRGSFRFFSFVIHFFQFLSTSYMDLAFTIK